MENQVRRILSHFYTPSQVERRLKKHINVKPNAFTVAKLLQQHTESEVIEIYKEKLEFWKKRNTLEGYIERHGPVDGPIKYKEKNSNLSVGIERLRRSGRTEEEIEAIKSRHSSKSAITLENRIERYGEELGTQLQKEWDLTTKERSCRCPEYWITRGYTLDEAKEKVSENQRRDLEFFIDKGWTEQEYLELCKRKTYAWSLDGYIERYGFAYGEAIRKYDYQKASDIAWFREKHGVVEGERLYYEMLSKKAMSAPDSNIQKEFATNIFNLLSLKVKSEFYGVPITEKNFIINVNENKFGIKCIVPDIRIKNIIVEFDGTYWHSSDAVKTRDLQKELLLCNLGYTVYRIAEHEYKANTEAVLNETAAFIESNIDYNFHNTLKRYQQHEN